MIGDFCKTELPYFDVCISNTPYQVSAICSTGSRAEDGAALALAALLDARALRLTRLSDLLAARLQAALAPAALPLRHPHVPARVCAAFARPSRLAVVVSAERQRAALRQGGPCDEGLAQLVPPAAAGREQCGAHLPHQPAAGDPLRGVRRPRAHRLYTPEQDGALMLSGQRRAAHAGGECGWHLHGAGIG